METTRILWRHEFEGPPRRGRPPRWTVDDIVQAATRVADATGSPDFTLRAVADEAGLPVMSLYAYVSGKEQLVDLMADHCRATMAFAPLLGSWPEMLRQVAAENLTLFREHPWLAHLESERAILGPGTLIKYERELGAVEPLPLDDVAKDSALSLLLDFVRASARSIQHAETERAAEEPTDWWAREAPHLTQLDLAHRFPRADRIGTHTGQHHQAAHSSTHAHQFGLDIIIRGLAQIPLVERTPTPSR